MKKKYLMNGMAVLALGLMAVSCSKEVEYSPEASKNHAEDVLGVTIDSNQDWKMSQETNVYVTVNLGLDQEYTVILYDKNPLYNSDAVYFVKQQVKEGGTAAKTISLPAASDTYYVAVFDTKKHCVVKTVTIEDGMIDITFGDTAAKTSRRASESDYQGSYAKSANDFLNPTTGRDVWGNTWQLTTRQISESEMKKYTAIYDNDIKENSTLSNKLNGDYYPGHSDGKHFRVTANTEIKRVFHVNGEYGVYNDVVIYIQGKVHLNGNTLNGPTLVVADGGEIIIDGKTDMSNAGRFVVLPGGKITGKKDAIYNVNNGAPCYNAGTIEFNGELNVNGSDVYNCGTINVDLLRNTSGGFFTNFGTITARTNIGAGDSYNSIIVNACYMKYTGNAGIGTLTMLDNSRLDVGGTAEFNQKTQTLYNNSVIDAGALYVNSTTFLGTDDTSDNAVIKTEKIYFADEMYVNQDKNDKYQNENWTYVARKIDGKGNIYLDWDNAQTYDKEGNQITLDNGYTMLSVVRAAGWNYTTESSSPFSIPAGECTGAGYNPGDDGGDIPGEPAVWTYAFEDSYFCDYDMNDLVIQVCENEDDEDKIDVTLCCTGATYDLYLYLGTSALFGGVEVHRALGGTAGKFINTGDTSNEKFESMGLQTTTINKPSGFTFATADFWILSPEGKIHVATNGQDPHGVVIPGYWAWPLEWVCVKEAYPDFVGFAADSQHQTNIDWYKNPDNDKTY